MLLFNKEEKTDLTKRNFNCRFYRFLQNGLDYIKWYTIICIRRKTDLVAEYHSTKKEYNLIPQQAVGVLKHDLNWP